MTASERKLLELGRKLASLDAEWKDWRAVSAVAEPFAKHHTQIDRIVTKLGALRGVLGQRLDDARKQPTTADVRAHELDILALHRVWGFFRAKLLQRGLPRLREHLAAADELAWACYQPTRVKARALGRLPDDRLREPPLVFFDGYSTPFTQTRDTRFVVESVEGEPIDDRQLAAFMTRLPIPIIGIPWFQSCHLPDALIVAHEVGHCVDDDLALGGAIATAAAGAVPARAAAWRAWAGESFADVYATLALGAAYVLALVDFLADRRGDVVAESATAADVYPTGFLRVALCVATLRLQGDPLADAIEADWKETYGDKHAMPAFACDPPAIAAALCKGPYAPLGGALTDVLNFGTSERMEIESCCTGLLAGEEPCADARIVFAAAAAIYRADPTMLDDEVQRRIRQGVIAFAGTGTRAGEPKPDDLATVDAEAGAALLDALTALHRQ